MIESELIKLLIVDFGRPCPRCVEYMRCALGGADRRLCSIRAHARDNRRCDSSIKRPLDAEAHVGTWSAVYAINQDVVTVSTGNHQEAPTGAPLDALNGTTGPSKILFHGTDNFQTYSILDGNNAVPVVPINPSG